MDWNKPLLSNSNNMWGRMAAPQFQAPLLHGKTDAEQFNIGPNSSIYLPDADNDFIWWIRTDNYGNKTVLCLDVSIHADKPQIDLNNLEMRLTAIEERLNAKQNKSNSKRRATETESATSESTVS